MKLLRIIGDKYKRNIDSKGNIDNLIKEVKYIDKADDIMVYIDAIILETQYTPNDILMSIMKYEENIRLLPLFLNRFYYYKMDLNTALEVGIDNNNFTCLRYMINKCNNISLELDSNGLNILYKAYSNNDKMFDFVIEILRDVLSVDDVYKYLIRFGTYAILDERPYILDNVIVQCGYLMKDQKQLMKDILELTKNYVEDIDTVIKNISSNSIIISRLI